MLWRMTSYCIYNRGISIFDRVNYEKSVFLPDIFGCDQPFNKYLKIRQLTKCNVDYFYFMRKLQA